MGRICYLDDILTFFWVEFIIWMFVDLMLNLYSRRPVHGYDQKH